MAKKLLLVGLGLLVVACFALFSLVPATPVSALDITDTPGGPPSATPAPTLTPTPTLDPGVNYPIGFAIDLEKFDQVYGDNVTTIKTWMTMPYSITAQSYAPPEGYPANVGWNGAVPTDEKVMPNYYPWQVNVVDNPYSATPVTYFRAYDGANNSLMWGPNSGTGCEPDGGNYSGPTFSVMMTDTSVGPVSLFTNDTGIPVNLYWYDSHELVSTEYQRNLSVPSGETVTGPAGIWAGAVYVQSTHWGEGSCWTMNWDLRQWMPDGQVTPTPNPIPTMAPPPPATYPLVLGITFEKYDPADGTNTTVVQTYVQEPYAIKKISKATGPRYWDGHIPDDLKFLVNQKPGEVRVTDPYAFESWRNNDNIFVAVDTYYYGWVPGGCAPDPGQPYQGSGTWIIVLDDPNTGPVLTFRNTTPFTMAVYWKTGFPPELAAISDPIPPGGETVGPAGIWLGYAYAINVEKPGESSCSEIQWFLSRWQPTPPTATPEPSATPLPTLPPMATPTNTPMLQQPPAAPSGLFATPTMNNFGLFWQDNASNESGYYVFYSLNGSTWTTAGELPPNSTSLAINGLACGTRYYVMVQAWNNTGSSNASGQYSTTTCFQTPTATPTPGGGGFKLFIPLVIKSP